MILATVHWPSLRGGLLVLLLLAIALFGASMPLVQHFGAGLGAFSTAALLYVGAAAVGVFLRQPVEQEARLTRADTPRLQSMAVLVRCWDQSLWPGACGIRVELVHR